MSILSWFHGGRGYWYHLREELDKAKSDYSIAVKNGLKDATKLGAYGVLLMQAGEFEEALKLMNLAIKNCHLPKDKSTRANIRTSRAIVYFMLGEEDKSLAALTDLHENYRNTRVYQCLGYVYLMRGDLESALKFNLEAFDYDEFDHTILDNLGDTYLKMGQLNEARKYLELAYEEKADQVDIRFHLGILEEDEDNYSKAIEHFKAADKCKLNYLNETTKDEIKAHILSCEEKLTKDESE